MGSTNQDQLLTTPKVMASVSGSIVPSMTETLTGEEKEMARPPAESALCIQCHPLFVNWL